MVNALLDVVDDFDVVIVSDQAETAAGGVVTARMREALTPIAEKKVVWVDSRVRAEHFRGVILKPNLDEAEAACRRVFGKVDFRGLFQHTGSSMMVVTQGGDGALVVNANGQRRSWRGERGPQIQSTYVGPETAFLPGRR